MEGKQLLSSIGVTPLLLQQDNIRTHSRVADKALEAWNSRENVNVDLLPSWPTQIRDLIPIESAWAHVQANLDAVGCKKSEDFQTTLLKELRYRL